MNGEILKATKLGKQNANKIFCVERRNEWGLKLKRAKQFHIKSKAVIFHFPSLWHSFRNDNIVISILAGFVVPSQRLHENHQNDTSDSSNRSHLTVCVWTEVERKFFPLCRNDTPRTKAYEWIHEAREINNLVFWWRSNELVLSCATRKFVGARHGT